MSSRNDWIVVSKCIEICIYIYIYIYIHTFNSETSKRNPHSPSFLFPSLFNVIAIRSLLRHFYTAVTTLTGERIASSFLCSETLNRAYNQLESSIYRITLRLRCFIEHIIFICAYIHCGSNNHARKIVPCL